MLKKLVIPSIVLFSTLSVMPVWATEEMQESEGTHEHEGEEGHEHEEGEGSHVHEGDINPWRIGAEIYLENQLFESDFGDLAGGAFETHAPGIDADVSKGAFQTGNWLQLKPVEPLQYWDGEDWSTTVPNGEYINIVDALGNTVRVDATGTAESSAVVGEIDTNGGIHAHIDFALLDASDTQNGSVGAYRIALKMFESAPNSEVSVSYAASPVVIVFNQGMPVADYEQAVSALSSGSQEDLAAEYDDNSGNLTIPEVKAFGGHFKVKLINQGNFEFKLLEAEPVEESHGHDH